MAFSGGSDRTRTSLSEINVTPLVDVVLVLLIIFMVTAPILQTGIEVNLPRTRSVQTVNPEQRAVITIGLGERLYYRSSAINFYELADRLRQEIGDSQENIFVQADEDVRWKTVATVIDEIQNSGYQTINLVTKPLKTEKP